MKKLLTLVALSTFCLFFSASCAVPMAQRQGTLLFYVKITDVALAKAPLGDTGIFFYTENYGGTVVTAYEMSDGAVRAHTGRDVEESAVLMRDLAAIDLGPFDFQAEVTSASERRIARLKALGQSGMLPFTLDGAKYEIGFNGPKGKFVLHEWNPGSTIEDLAGDSENIDKLRRVIDRFATYYGRSRFGL